MLKISRKLSVMLSLGLTILFMVALVFGAMIMPVVAGRFIAMRYPDGQLAGQEFFVLLLAYGILAVAALADVLLFLLLRRVLAGLVFTPRSVSYVRYISWCGILFGVLFMLMGLYFRIAFAVAFAGFFLGLCVRVVKNVIEEATAIKEEHDLTV